jgi:hypothetical protein
MSRRAGDGRTKEHQDMWGNRLGWRISAGIVIVVVGLVVLLQMTNTISPPSALGRNPKNLAPIALPIAPASVLKTMTDDCDAGELYRQAIADYRKNPRPYDHFDPSHPPAAARLAALSALVKAAHCKNMTLLAADPARVVNYNSDHPDLVALEAVGNTAIKIGLIKQSDKAYAEARKYEEAAFALGAKLYQERVIYDELSTGLGLMSSAAGAMVSLEKHAGNSDRAGEWADFNDQRGAYVKEHLNPIWGAISSIDARVVARTAGDIFVFAQQSKEPLWRTEATLKLGRQRFYSTRGGDQRGAIRVLEHLADNPKEPPAVHAAAQAAQALTLEQYLQLGRYGSR